MNIFFSFSPPTKQKLHLTNSKLTHKQTNKHMDSYTFTYTHTHTHSNTITNTHTMCITDLFDQPIELELGAMDFAGFQMLSDPNATMIADPTIEDSFRRDLN